MDRRIDSDDEYSQSECGDSRDNSFVRDNYISCTLPSVAPFAPFAPILSSYTLAGTGIPHIPTSPALTPAIATFLSKDVYSTHTGHTPPTFPPTFPPTHPSTPVRYTCRTKDRTADVGQAMNYSTNSAYSAYSANSLLTSPVDEDIEYESCLYSSTCISEESSVLVAAVIAGCSSEAQTEGRSTVCAPTSIAATIAATRTPCRGKDALIEEELGGIGGIGGIEEGRIIAYANYLCNGTTPSVCDSNLGPPVRFDVNHLEKVHLGLLCIPSPNTHILPISSVSYHLLYVFFPGPQIYPFPHIFCLPPKSSTSPPPPPQKPGGKRGEGMVYSSFSHALGGGWSTGAIFSRDG